MGLVRSREQTGRDRSVGGVGEQLDRSDAAAQDVLLGELHREGRGRHLVLNGPQHATDRGDAGQVPGTSRVHLRPELVGQRRVHERHELVVGEPALGIVPPSLATTRSRSGFSASLTLCCRPPSRPSSPSAIRGPRYPAAPAFPGLSHGVPSPQKAGSQSAPGRIRTCVKRIRSPLPKSARPPGHAGLCRPRQPDIGAFRPCACAARPVCDRAPVRSGGGLLCHTCAPRWA